MIEIKDIRFTYSGNHHPSLTNVSLTLKKGGFLSVLGANDSGKTTLCRLLTGFIPHFYKGTLDGEYRIDGEDTRNRSPWEMRRITGFVFQNPLSQLSGIKYTVRNEIAFGLENMGVPRHEMIPRIQETLAELDIESLADRHPETLSGGEMQKVAIASILVMKPDIIVLDEPASRLDPASTKQIYGMLNRLKQRGLTVIIAQTAFDTAVVTADRVLLLDKGEMIACDEPSRIMDIIHPDTHGVVLPVFHETARAASTKNLWPKTRGLPHTFDEAVEGFLRVLGREPDE